MTNVTFRTNYLVFFYIIIKNMQHTNVDLLSPNHLDLLPDDKKITNERKKNTQSTIQSQTKWKEHSKTICFITFSSTLREEKKVKINNRCCRLRDQLPVMLDCYCSIQRPCELLKLLRKPVQSEHACLETFCFVINNGNCLDNAIGSFYRSRERGKRVIILYIHYRHYYLT